MSVPVHGRAERTHLQDGDAHQAHAVVGQQLHFDGGRPHKGQRDGAKVGAHGRQPDLQPHLALQVQITDKHRDLQQAPSCIRAQVLKLATGSTLSHRRLLCSHLNCMQLQSLARGCMQSVMLRQ